MKLYGKLSLQSGADVSEFSTDGTLAGNSDSAVPTEKAVKTYVDTVAGSEGPPAAPTNLVLSQISDSIQVQFDASATTSIDEYEVWASVGDQSSYGLVGVIPKDDMLTTMAILDDTFERVTTIYYRVYAIKSGNRSSALSGSITATGMVTDVSGLKVDNFLNFYFIQYSKPQDRRLDHIEIKMHKNAVQGSLSEASATLIYSGLADSYLYKIPEVDEGLYHQFWVYTITRN
ncbi:hypothetical protein [Acinetobacter sp.]|uniref:hypothetical protein n=1 Tax=Acinetobacter sp. TaxID=472 RepID=UPI003D082493